MFQEMEIKTVNSGEAKADSPRGRNGRQLG